MNNNWTNEDNNDKNKVLKRLGRLEVKVSGLEFSLQLAAATIALLTAELPKRFKQSKRRKRRKIFGII